VSVDERVRRAVETAVPEPAAAGDWDGVVADAERSGRGRLALSAGAVAAAIVAVAAVVLVAPFDDRQPTFFEQALAAVGEGPVVHLVLRGDWGGAYLDLDSGEVTPVYGETEIWYDPKRGLRQISLLDGKPQGEGFTPPDRIRAAELEQYQGLTNRYREALASGRAREVAEGEVDGRPVRWIRIHAEFLPDSADGKDHLFAHEVAVDRATHEPVYLRTTRDGRPGPRGSGQAIATMELLPEGAGDFPRGGRERSEQLQFGVRRGAEISLVQAREAFGGRALWLGESFADLPRAGFLELDHEQRTRTSDPWTVTRSLAVQYTSERVRAHGFPGFWVGVTVEQAERPLRTWRGAPADLDLPDGTAYVSGGSGLARTSGLYVSVQAADTRRVVEALGALRPIRGGDPVAPAVARLGAERLTERIERARPHVEVTGSDPVPPRSVKVEGPPVQTGSTHGVTVRIHAPNIAVFDTSRIDPSVRRLVGSRFGFTCFRAANMGRGGGGGGAAKHGRFVVRLSGKAPYDGCQVSGSFGRRWGSGRSWHAPVELALTAAGRRYFAERAAARELAYFVRSPAMSAVRRALKRETGEAPPAAELAGRFDGAAVGLASPDANPPEGKIGIWTDADDQIKLTKVVGGKTLFVELREGRIARTNARPLAFIF
jgi:hypothetical protein